MKNKKWLWISAGIILMSYTIFKLIPIKNEFNESVPEYIQRDNKEDGYKISHGQITLGRVLFYDNNLSLNKTINCASCHQQEYAFSDSKYLSEGYLGDSTGRHSMRLINTRFSFEKKFFWDERATTLESQTTMPIQDHVEMGFSGLDGNPNIDSLVERLAQIPYYKKLFIEAFENDEITEKKLQMALAQFVTSIQSFDSKFDEGLALTGNNRANFPNYTNSENRGKSLYLRNVGGGGAACNRCHRAPDFAIRPNSLNNGIIGVAGDSTSRDLSITRAPTLRDLVNPHGILNGPMMHDASITSLKKVIKHYNNVPSNSNLDRRLQNRGGNLQLSETEMTDLENFLLTLTGKEVYTNEKWSNPFSEDESLDLSKLSSFKYE